VLRDRKELLIQIQNIIDKDLSYEETEREISSLNITDEEIKIVLL
jgi:hypothetical protein